MSISVSKAGARLTIRQAGAAPFRAIYTYEAWEDELYLAYAEGSAPKPCPACRRTGFYGPRFAAPDTRYRSCRFCGLWQSVAGEPNTSIPTMHGCDAWPHAAHAPYLWWVVPTLEHYGCPFCSAQVLVRDATVRVPHRDERHPWWRVPQGRSARYYRRFWENWEVTKGRLFI